MGNVERVDPSSNQYLLMKILEELRSMNPYRMSRPTPEGDDPVNVESGTGLAPATLATTTAADAATSSADVSTGSGSATSAAPPDPPAPDKPGPVAVADSQEPPAA